MGGGSLEEPGKALRPLLAPTSVSLGEFRRGTVCHVARAREWEPGVLKTWSSFPGCWEG